MMKLDELARALQGANSMWDLSNSLPLFKAGIADAAARISELERAMKELKTLTTKTDKAPPQ